MQNLKKEILKGLLDMGTNSDGGPRMKSLSH